MDHMLDASRRGHVRRHVLLDLVENRKETPEMAENMTQEPGAQENCDNIAFPDCGLGQIEHMMAM
jgi:hypothetical protein